MSTIGSLFWYLPNARSKLAWHINCNAIRPDLVMMRFFNEKSVYVNFNHPPAYIFWYTGIYGWGLFIGCWMRTFFCSSEIAIRRSEYYKPWPDKHWTFHFSLPFYNHALRTWSAKYRASFVDNEPDYNAYHPWAIRPNRNLHYARLPLIFSNKRYFIDDPNFERTRHCNMEAHYEKLGYYPDRKKKNRKRNAPVSVPVARDP